MTSCVAAMTSRSRFFVIIQQDYTDRICKSSGKLKNNLSSSWILDPGLLRVPELSG